MKRRTFLRSLGITPWAGMGALAMAQSPATAAVKSIDGRLFESGDASKYFVVFCTRRSGDISSKPGHAYVVWGKEDAGAQMSVAQAFGFYPDSPSGSMVLGMNVPGQLKDEAFNSSPTLLTGRLIVRVDKVAFDRSRSEQDKWKTGDYNLYQRNCISFASAVAEDIGLVGLPGSVTEWPADFFADLVSKVRTRLGGTWSSSDDSHRFGLTIDGPKINWTERSATGSLTKAITAKAAANENSIRLERPNTDEVLSLLGFSDAALRAEILAAAPQPSYLILRPTSDGLLGGEWHGLVVKKKANGHLDSLVQPVSVPAKQFAFVR